MYQNESVVACAAPVIVWRLSLHVQTACAQSEALAHSCTWDMRLIFEF